MSIRLSKTDNLAKEEKGLRALRNIYSLGIDLPRNATNSNSSLYNFLPSFPMALLS